jgi:hypothetical protein
MSQKPEQKFNEELIKTYGRSEKGNFGVVDTMPEKHAYCIGAKHVGHASDHFSGILGDDAIRDGEEKKGIYCATCEAAFKRRDTNKIMTWDEHKTGLLVQCKVKPTNENQEGKELQTYMKKCTENKHFKKGGYIGFLLLDNFKK